MSRRPLIVLTHVFNEEFLLPHWIRHHRRMFDHGVVVDRGSTDGSMEIVRALAPDWDIVPSRTAVFDARECDYEMMDLEGRYDGWKAVLNVTEFVFHPDLDTYLTTFEAEHPEVQAVGMRCVVMVDPVEDRAKPVDDEPLALQRFHGILPDPADLRRYRYAHRARHGDYMPGRHQTGLFSIRDPELLLLRFTWAPYEQVKARRLQIASAIPETDLRQGMSWEHVVTEDELDQRYLEFAGRARDLRADPVYGPALGQVSASLASGRQRPKVSVKPVTPRAVRERIAIITADAIDLDSDAAPQRRRRALAEGLAGEHEVRLASLAEAKGSSGRFAVEAIGDSDILPVLGWAQIAVADFEMLCAHPDLRHGFRPLAVDLAGAPLDRAQDDWILLRGDVFLCADEEEREAALEVLAAAGRLDERLGADDPRVPALLWLMPPDPTEEDLDRLVAFCRRPQRPPGNLLTETERRLMSSRLVSKYRRRLTPP